MTTYYVATRALYVLVEASNEAEARRLAAPMLQALRAEISEGAARQPIEIRTVREAVEEEIELVAFDARNRAAR